MKSLLSKLRTKPIAEVDTAAGRIYLYPLRVKDFNDLVELESSDPVRSIKRVLPSISSLSVQTDEHPERIPLDPQHVHDLSEADIERLAEVYITSAKWDSTVLEKSNVRNRGKDSPASERLVSLLEIAVDRHQETLKKQYAGVLERYSGLFHSVEKSSNALGISLAAYDRLSHATRVPPSFEPVRTDRLSAVNDKMERVADERARERTEELEMVRLTGQMTAESARMLKDLVKTATTLMAQLDERDLKADKSTRVQVSIAVWSLAFSVILAAFAVALGWLSFSQDRRNNSSGDLWQSAMLATVESGNKQQAAFAAENLALRDQLNALEAQIAELKDAQRAASKAADTGQRQGSGKRNNTSKR